MDLKIRYNGLGSDPIVSEFEAETLGGYGLRKVRLSGWGRTEIAAREQILEQAKAMRNELNLAIEDMITDLCAAHTQS